jgi:hypothetical protein
MAAKVLIHVAFAVFQICERAVCNSQRLKSREDFVPNCWRSGRIGYVREARPQEGGVSILVKTSSSMLALDLLLHSMVFINTLIL